MNKIVDFFGHDILAHKDKDINWKKIVEKQHCPYVDRRCYKVRKSQSEISIGTCTVNYRGPVIICHQRLLERKKIFTDALHLLNHEPGSEIHIIPEVGIPGGNIDYFLTSIRDGKVRDFVGIELQTLDTTGTVWPERQRLLKQFGLDGISEDDTANVKTFGMNWKMTAKTILVQLHHKIQTFESIGKHLVLATQDRLLAYMAREFTFQHLNEPRSSDPMHFHAYGMENSDTGHSLKLVKRLSTDTDGIARCLGLKSEAKIEAAVIAASIEKKITDRTRFEFNAPSPIDLDPIK